MDPNLNKLLKWSLQNQTPAQSGSDSNQPAQNDTATTAAPSTTDGDGDGAAPPRGPSLDPSALASILFNAPSDAEMMQRSLAAIKNKEEIPLDSRLVAWDNLEQLVENLDNANNLENLKMWPPLREELETAEAWEEREFAAWCVGTSVQNNVKSQDALVKHSVIPVLTRLAISDPSPQVRKKTVFALSSAVRNHQSATDQFVACLKDSDTGKELLAGDDKIDSADMERLNKLMEALRNIKI